MPWLTVVLSLPPTPTRHRVGVWRKLQRIGAVRLKGSAWLLPETPATRELFEWLVQEVQSSRGGAALLHVDRIETMRDDEVEALFERARAADYEPVVRGCRELLSQLDRARHVPVAHVRGRLEALKRELDRVQTIDYLASPAGRRARALWERVAKRLTTAEARPAPRSPRRRGGALPPAGSTWVTRPRPHIDRIASAWLVRRFFDPHARFTFAEPPDAPRNGVPFDIVGAEFGHHGDDCTFETLVKRFGVRDRRIRAIAEIVHAADLRDGKFTRTEARGIDLAIAGLAESTLDDGELLERGMAMFDGLYAVLERNA